MPKPQNEEHVVPPHRVGRAGSNLFTEAQPNERPDWVDVRIIRSLGDLIIDLELEFIGMDILVRAGRLVVDGQEGELLQDERYKVPTHNVDADVQVFLVKSRDTGEYRILVDDVKQDLEDLAFSFTLTCPYVLVSSLALLAVPAQCADLQLTRKTIYKVKV